IAYKEEAPACLRLGVDAMSEAETQLLALLKERSFKVGDFRLYSGDRSSYYIDGKMAQVYSAGARLIGQVLYERTKDLAIDGVGVQVIALVDRLAGARELFHLYGIREYHPVFDLTAFGVAVKARNPVEIASRPGFGGGGPA